MHLRWLVQVGGRGGAVVVQSGRMNDVLRVLLTVAVAVLLVWLVVYVVGALV
jgi:hypothetical protein